MAVTAKQTVYVRCEPCNGQGFMWRFLLGFKGKEVCLICGGTGRANIGSRWQAQEERANGRA